MFMPWFARWYFLLCRLLSKPLIRVVKPQTLKLNEGLVEALQGRPVCYVLREHSWTDRFLLERLLKSEGLPPLRSRAGQLPDNDNAACLYLPVLNGRRGGDRGRQAMAALVERAGQSDMDIQIVAVSLFWGRDPGAETSFLRLLLGDGERAGAIRKLLVIIAQRNNLLVHIAQPVSFEKLVSHSREPAAAARLLARTLSFYFSRRKTATLGPSLLSRQHIINIVLRRQLVRDTIERQASKGDGDVVKLHKKARKMANEVAANFDSRLLRILDLLLSWLFRKLFSGIQVQHMERLQKIASDRQLIYMPSHRSHLDYLLISYTLYKQGLAPPHIAAGVNLNFWPVGGLLRRGGAFYIRRSFAGQELYAAIFRSYLEVILGRGYPIEFFPEGGRSRTGRLLPPKKGMLKMTLESLIQQPARKAAIVPVYVGYDKLVEGGSYAKELRGAAKRKESAGSLFEARKIFKSSYGSPHVAFGEPILVDEALSRAAPQWRQRAQKGDLDFLPTVIDELAQLNMERINAAAVVNPIGLVAAILLSSPQRAMAEDELLAQIDYFVTLLRQMPFSDDVVLPDGNSRDILDRAARTAGLSRIDHPWGPIITATGTDAVMLTYYRNSIMHVLALPSLIARFFRHSSEVSEQELLTSCRQLYPFLRRELFLPALETGDRDRIADKVDALVQLKLLRRNTVTGTLRRPDVGTEAYAVLIGLGRVLRESLERYTMTSLLLARELGELPASRGELERHITEMAQRLAILSGREAPEYFDKTQFRIFLDCLVDEKLLSIGGDGEAQSISIDSRLETYARRWVALLGPDVQQSMLHLLRR